MATRALKFNSEENLIAAIAGIAVIAEIETTNSVKEIGFTNHSFAKTLTLEGGFRTKAILKAEEGAEAGVGSETETLTKE